MSRRAPFDFTDREPAIKNAGGVPLSQITRGSELFATLAGADTGLPPLNEQSSLMVAAIYSCVALIGGAIATLPLRIYHRDGEGLLDELKSDELWWLLNEQMLPRWSAANGWEFITGAKLIRGDGYAKIHRGVHGGVRGFEPLHYDRVQPVPTPDGTRLLYSVAPDWTVPNRLQNGFEVLDQDDVLHFAGFGFDGVRGLSPLRYWLRQSGAVALATQEYSARFFANNARPDYFLGTDGSMSPEGIEGLRKQIDEQHQGVQSSHRPMVLTQGLKPLPLSLSAEDMQLLATRQFQIEEICRIFGIPPFMIGHNEKTTSWGSGVEAMGVGFVRYALRRHLNKFENELNRKLFRSAGKVVKFDVTELERADFKSLVEAFRMAVGRAGEPMIMTPEEVRERLDMPPKPKVGTLSKGAPNAPDKAAEPPGP